MEISRLDHFVLTVKDLQQTVAFYTQVLGMKEVRFGEGRIALEYGNKRSTCMSWEMNLNLKHKMSVKAVLTCALSPKRH